MRVLFCVPPQRYHSVFRLSVKAVKVFGVQIEVSLMLLKLSLVLILRIVPISPLRFATPVVMKVLLLLWLILNILLMLVVVPLIPIMVVVLSWFLRLIRWLLLKLQILHRDLSYIILVILILVKAIVLIILLIIIVLLIVHINLAGLMHLRRLKWIIEALIGLVISGPRRRMRLRLVDVVLLGLLGKLVEVLSLLLRNLFEFLIQSGLYLLWILICFFS